MKQLINLLKSFSKFNYSSIFKNILIFFGKKIVEISVMKKKLSNLEKTNFDLGVKRMTENHIGEAIFRFKIVKKFWPKNKESYLKLIECFIIKNKKQKAEKVAKELMLVDSSYLDKIDKIIKNG
jgi:hypothetical protein